MILDCIGAYLSKITLYSILIIRLIVLMLMGFMTLLSNIIRTLFGLKRTYPYPSNPNVFSLLLDGKSMVIEKALLNKLYLSPRTSNKTIILLIVDTLSQNETGFNIRPSIERKMSFLDPKDIEKPIGFLGYVFFSLHPKNTLANIIRTFQVDEINIQMEHKILQNDCEVGGVRARRRI